jgi:hypothetical protein
MEVISVQKATVKTKNLLAEKGTENTAFFEHFSPILADWIGKPHRVRTLNDMNRKRSCNFIAFCVLALREYPLSRA